MLLAIPFGLAIGLAVGTLGGGGSVLAVPVLVYVLDQTVPEATTASLVVVAAGAVAGGLSHARAGRVCWRHAGSFTAAALPGIALGTLAAEAVSGPLLLAGFALVMLAAAHATWRKAEDSEPEPDGTVGARAAPARRCGCRATSLAGAAVGLVTGFFGVGGGFLIVPTLAIALAFTMRTAVGTSLAIITATSLLGLGAHLLAGRIARRRRDRRADRRLRRRRRRRRRPGRPHPAARARSRLRAARRRRSRLPARLRRLPRRPARGA